MNLMSDQHKENSGYNRHCNSRKTTEQFIEDAKKVHGDRYDYSKVHYNNSHAKVVISCLKHGSFRQTPSNHLKAQGCPNCKNDRLRSTIDMFVEKAKKVHDDKYNYNKVEYIDSRNKVTITCLEHGDFRQSPNNHLREIGCPNCKNDRLRSTIEQFIENARKVHGDRYDYSKVEYVGSQNKVIITCLEHGDFKQSANHHSRGVGCPVCKSSKGEIAIRKILLKHDIEFTQEYSIPNQNNRYKYDFYLPKLNLIIEYHGAQHYIPVEYFGGEEGLNRIKLRDSLKKDIAKECGYKFLEIKYSHFLNSTEEEFEKKLLYVLTKTRSLALTK